MAGRTGTEALNVVIEKLSEICSTVDKKPDAADVDNRSVASQTPAVCVVPAVHGIIAKSRSLGASPNTSPTKQDRFKCEECDYSSHNKHYLKQHVDLVHSTDRPFKCPFCDYAGKRSYALKEHLIVHSNDRPFECTHCNATFRKKGHLTNHIKMHASQWNFDCSLCHASFATRADLYTHVGQHAKDNKDIFACEQCLFATLDKTLIYKHIESGMCDSVATKSLKCDTCNFTATNKGELVDHKAVHAIDATNRTPTILLKCSECGFTSTEQEVLESHIINKHLPKVTPPSRKSTQSFKSIQPKVSTPTLIPMNKNTQSLVPPKGKYFCNVCGFASDDSQSLAQHMATHATKQINPKHLTPNQSENTCVNPDSVKFSYDASLRIFHCSICGYTCEHQRTIKSHIWRHSGHKDVGYPMFQNGPLSIYDDAPGRIKSQELAQVNITSGNHIKPTSTENSQEQHQSVLPEIVAANVSVSSSSDSTAVQASLSSNMSSTSASQPVRAVPLPVSANTVLAEILKPQSVIVLPPNRVVDSQEHQQPTLMNDSMPSVTEEGKNYLNVNCGTQEISQGGTEVVIVDAEEIAHNPTPDVNLSSEAIVKEAQEQEEESMESCPIAKVGKKRKHDDLDGNDDDEVDNDSDKRSCVGFILETEAGETVLVEKVEESCLRPTLNLDTGATVEVNDTGSDTTSVTSEADPSSAVANVAVVKSHPDAQPTDLDVDDSSASDNLTETLIIEVTEHTEEVSDNQSESENRQKMNVADGLAKIEMSRPVTRQMTLSTDIARGLRRSSKSGISSSLLAVIEQLRERSKSDSDHDEIDPPLLHFPKVQPASRVTKRSRSKRSSTEDSVDIESYQNVEKLESGMYRCKLCHYKSHSTSLMKQHMRLHKSKQPFECSLCDFIADASETLQDHMLQHCKIRTYQCKLCPSTFNYKSQLRAHMRAHNETDPFTCDVCDFETFNPILFRNHAKIHKEKKGYHCKDCQGVFTDNCEDENHEKEDLRSARNLSCDECGLVLQSQEDLKKHQKSHIKQLRCEQCNFSCSTLGRMRNHYRLHLDDKPMQCNLCDFTAISTRSLKSHMKRHINDQRYVQQPLEQYKCNLCGYVCHHLPSLKSHMWRHASETGYSYEDANDAINAAIDYENNLNPSSKIDDQCSQEDSDDDTDTDAENVQVIENVKELLRSRKVVKVGIAQGGKSDGNTLVTFRCCQCGFESISRVQLTNHMKQHADIITKTLEISQYSSYKKIAPLKAAGDNLTSAKEK